MAYYSKDVYERKAAYAARRMEENAQVPTLTDEQHDTLAYLCYIRHWIHSTDRMRLFNEESNEYSEMSRYLYEIDEGMLSMADLPALETIDFFYALPTSGEWDLVMDDADRAAYVPVRVIVVAVTVPVVAVRENDGGEPDGGVGCRRRPVRSGRSAVPAASCSIPPVRASKGYSGLHELASAEQQAEERSKYSFHGSSLFRQGRHKKKDPRGQNGGRKIFL